MPGNYEALTFEGSDRTQYGNLQKRYLIGLKNVEVVTQQTGTGKSEEQRLAQ